jgi:type IV pilus assembly protein PilC
MPVYVWRGKNQYGEKRKGEVVAATPEAAATAVKRLRISEAKIKEKPKDLFENVSFLQKKVTQKDIVVFYQATRHHDQCRPCPGPVH